MRQQLLRKEKAGRERGWQIDEVDDRDGGVGSRQVSNGKAEGDEGDRSQQDAIAEGGPLRRVQPHAAGDVGEWKKDGKRQGCETERRDALGKQVDERRQWRRPHQQVHLHAALGRDRDAEAEDHHVGHGVNGHRGQEVRAELDKGGRPHRLAGLPDTDEAVEHDRQKQAGEAERRHAPELEKLGAGLPHEHGQHRCPCGDAQFFS